MRGDDDWVIRDFASPDVVRPATLPFLPPLLNVSNEICNLHCCMRQGVVKRLRRHPVRISNAHTWFTIELSGSSLRPLLVILPNACETVMEPTTPHPGERTTLERVYFGEHSCSIGAASVAYTPMGMLNRSNFPMPHHGLTALPPPPFEKRATVGVSMVRSYIVGYYIERIRLSCLANPSVRWHWIPRHGQNLEQRSIVLCPFRTEIDKTASNWVHHRSCDCRAFSAAEPRHRRRYNSCLYRQ
jgi:hypothetical protein